MNKGKDKLELFMQTLIPELRKLIEKTAKQNFKTYEDQAAAALNVGINLAGNLAMCLSDDSIESKMEVSYMVLKSLQTWFDYALSDYKKRKEIH